MKSCKNNLDKDTADKICNTANDTEVDMNYMAEFIISSGKEIKIHGNKFKFNVKKIKKSPLSFTGKFTINDETPEGKCGVKIEKDRIIIHAGADDMIKINYKGKTFGIFPKFELNSDFSIKNFILAKNEKYNLKEPFQDIYLKFFNSCKIYNQNFYTFKKNDNNKYYISEEKQHTTFKFGKFCNEVKLDFDKMSKDEKTKFLFLQKIAFVCEEEYECEEFKITFANNRAFVLIKNLISIWEQNRDTKEYFCKSCKEIEPNKNKDFYRLNFDLCELTAFKNKAFVGLTYETEYSPENIFVFGEELETKIKADKDENKSINNMHNYLNRINVVNNKRLVSSSEFQPILKNHFLNEVETVDKNVLCSLKSMNEKKCIIM